MYECKSYRNVPYINYIGSIRETGGALGLGFAGLWIYARKGNAFGAAHVLEFPVVN
ncbi:hypothetical protein [Methanochimaera problematica]|uniref:hypothetical protein n=1 Tax=Methanochimaera problematica TaxID=2609417 RepID=UPI00293911D2|nr:hypothetical protein [Methanoplanus sp. FWC-SCC4]